MKAHKPEFPAPSAFSCPKLAFESHEAAASLRGSKPLHAGGAEWSLEMVCYSLDPENATNHANPEVHTFLLTSRPMKLPSPSRVCGPENWEWHRLQKHRAPRSLHWFYFRQGQVSPLQSSPTQSRTRVRGWAWAEVTHLQTWRFISTKHETNTFD